MTEPTGIPLLLVDDDLALRETVAEVLRDEGYEVAEAEHGLAALNLLQAGLRPAVILLDLMMPVMDGSTFCRAVRSDPALAALPVVVISANARAHEQGTACGANETLPKPFDIEALLKVVARWAGRRTER